MNTISTEDLVANLDINDEEAIKKMEEIFGLEENTLSFIIEARDHASEPIIAVSEMEMKDKLTNLIGQDNATPYINLWNMMSANPKFSSLTADDQASCVVDTYNNLSIKDQNLLLTQTGGEQSLSIAQSIAQSITRRLTRPIAARQTRWGLALPGRP